MRIKRLIFVLALLTQSAGAAVVQKSFSVTATGGAPIPIAYDKTDAKSLVASSLTYPQEIIVCNDTASRIWSSLDGTANAEPAANKEFPVPAGGCLVIENKRDLEGVTTVYIRSATGSTITSTDVRGTVR